MISYDTNVLIYALESGSLSARAQDIILTGEQRGAVLSVLTLQEVLSGVALRGGEVDTLKNILSQFISTEFVPVTQKIANRAVALTQAYGRKVKGYDAIMLATAIEYGCKEFWTNDVSLQKLVISEVSIRSLDHIPEQNN